MLSKIAQPAVIKSNASMPRKPLYDKDLLQNPADPVPLSHCSANKEILQIN